MAAVKFDLYNGDEKVQTSVESPIVIKELTPETEYKDYAVSYEGKTDKTPMTFTTKKSEAPTTVAVTGVTLDKTENSIEIGANATAVATIAPDDATDKSVSWASSDEAIATVDKDGKYTGVKDGSANITVTTTDGKKTATLKLTVTKPASANVPVTGVTMSQKTAALKVGDTKQVTGAVAPEDATDKAVTYASDNEKIATVAEDGTITAVAEGTANITVTTHDGSKTDKCVVTVAKAS